MSRKDDLEQNIRECYALIRQYEVIQRDTDRPEERDRAGRVIKEQWELIRGYLDEYMPLCERLRVRIADDLKGIVLRFPRYTESLQSQVLHQVASDLTSSHPELPGEQERSVLVIGHSLDAEVVCVEWDSPEPNVADYDVVIMDLTTTQTIQVLPLGTSIQPRFQVDQSRYLQWSHIRRTVGRQLLSGGRLFIITNPEIVMHPDSPGAALGHARRTALLPFVPFGERVPAGQSIKWNDPRFDFYFREVGHWNFVFTGRLDEHFWEHFDEQVTCQVSPLAKNRAGEILALSVLVWGRQPTGVGVAYMLPPPTKTASSRAIELLIAHLDDLWEVPQWGRPDELEASIQRTRRTRRRRTEPGSRPPQPARTVSADKTPDMHLAEDRLVRILHISDTHRAPDAPTSNTTLLGKLLDDIRHTYDEDNARLGPGEPRLGSPDLIVISGDLTQRADEAEFQTALSFLEGLLPLVDGNRQRMVLVPGNHDLDWAIAAQSYTPATKEDYDNQPPPGEPYRQSIKRAPDGTYWRKDEATYTDRFKPFKAFFDTFYQDAYTYPVARDHMFTVYDLSELLGLVVVGFNSCDEIDAYLHEGRLSSLDRRAFINTDAIYNAQQSPAFHASQADLLRIAVFHHNIRSVAHGEDFLEPKYLQILKRHGFHLCLHGHMHTAGHDLFDATQARVLPVVGAGSLSAPYSDRPPAAPMGYNLVVIDRQSGGIWVHARRHDEDHLVWAADYRSEWEGKPYFAVRAPERETPPRCPEAIQSPPRFATRT